jgi:glutamate carboxypeptidase
MTVDRGTSIEALGRFCEAHLDDTLATIAALAGVESPSLDKAAVDRCGAELASVLADAGCRVERVAQSGRGDHLVARLPGDGRPTMILGHFDTVWPVGTLARMPLRRDGDRLYGPGVFDMKAGIAIALSAIRALEATATPHTPIVMLWTADEEIGSGSSRALIEAEARGCGAVLVMEPALPGGALKTARKGCGEFELVVHGIAAHAGLDPEKGASAIHELAAQIGAIERLQDLPRGISVNVGLVSGGSRANVVADEARAVIDARAPTRAAAEAIDAVLRGLQPLRSGTRLTISGGFDRPPMERTAAGAELFARARALAARLGRDLAEGSAGGGSDGNFTSALGVPTLDGLGAIGDGAHAAHENVEISSLGWRSALVAGLLAGFTQR